MMFKQMMIISVALLSLASCTQEAQNKLERAVQNWTGVHGVLEIYSGNKLVRRFLEIDKLSTAISTNGNTPRPYRYGYGILDENLNMVSDHNEKKVYFEFSDYATPYIFFTRPE